MNASIKSILLTSLVTLLLYFSGFLVFATPVPVIFFVLRQRREEVVKLLTGLCVVGALIYFVGQPLIAHYRAGGETISTMASETALTLGVVREGLLGLGRFLLYVSLGFFIAQIFKLHLKKAPQYIFYYTTGIFVTVGLLFLAVLGRHISLIIDVYRAQTLAGFKDFIAAQEKAGVGFEQLVVLQSWLPNIVKHAVYLMPFGLWLFVVVMFLLNLLLFRNYFMRNPLNAEAGNLNLSLFKAPFVCVWCVIGLAGIFLLSARLGPSLIPVYGALNFLAAFGFVYFLQGVAVIVHFIERRKIFGPFQFFAYLILFFLIVSLPPILPLVGLLGFSENWIDLRKEKSPARTRTGL